MTQEAAVISKTADYALRGQLGFKLSRASRLMQQRLEAELATHGLTRLTWCVLSSVGLEKISTPSGISDNIGITRPMLSRLFKAMTKDGLIQSALTPEDGRARRITLTDLGQEKLDACLPLVDRNAAFYASKFTDAERAVLHRLLDVLAHGEGSKLESI